MNRLEKDVKIIKFNTEEKPRVFVCGGGSPVSKEYYEDAYKVGKTVIYHDTGNDDNHEEILFLTSLQISLGNYQVNFGNTYLYSTDKNDILIVPD